MDEYLSCKTPKQIFMENDFNKESKGLNSQLVGGRKHIRRTD